MKTDLKQTYFFHKISAEVSRVCDLRKWPQQVIFVPIKNEKILYLKASLYIAGIFTKVNQQADPAAAPVPQPDNAEERLQLLKKAVQRLLV